ncbi:PHO88-related membrane protein [Laccaria bicolor S238N-H82]|uniref:PHO88-related membrane protein n=1 Tax=Laccaria bicolor (strain S238N-H82 / ATCC MYA-4686) TaxID=486041 RepID=B0DDN3_LACBS|nr:PHO88-related membrane protein [Laccaria bicolor S238N-H82]EDR07119.1 PHO88-related membrane protein [Laccaria bicolor S238N-H82]|eukprot:XP_001882050.1 PHO88-related membrane protein [Laccaria bicolor S238N-H82]
MNAGVQNLVISLGAMQLARKIPFEDPLVLNYVRAGYVLAQVIVLAVYYYVSLVIKRKNDQTVLKYVEAPPPMSQEPGNLVTTTVRDYDLSETSKLLRSVYLGIAMMGVMHFYLNFTQPLFIQALMGVKGLYDAKPVSIHLLGNPAVDDLKRPFKVASFFGPASGPLTDAASIAEAEKRASKKEE